MISAMLSVHSNKAAGQCCDAPDRPALSRLVSRHAKQTASGCVFQNKTTLSLKSSGEMWSVKYIKAAYQSTRSDTIKRKHAGITPFSTEC